MRISFWNRLLAALSGLMILLIGIGLFVFGIGVFPFKVDVSALNGSFELWQRAVMVLAALLLGLMGLNGISLLVRRRGDKGFIMQHTELGDMSISMNALESMVHKCVDQHQELTVRSTKIDRSKDGIVVEIRILLASGVNIPLTVNALQKQIKQYITSCSGVDVHEVRVLVETGARKLDGSTKEPVAPVVHHVPQPEPAKPSAEEKAADNLLRHTEEPSPCAAPVVQEVPGKPEAEPEIIIAQEETADTQPCDAPDAPDLPQEDARTLAQEGEAPPQEQTAPELEPVEEEPEHE